jgi:hypothetical protein
MISTMALQMTQYVSTDSKIIVHHSCMKAEQVSTCQLRLCSMLVYTVVDYSVYSTVTSYHQLVCGLQLAYITSIPQK